MLCICSWHDTILHTKDLSAKNRYVENMEAYLISNPKSPPSDWSRYASRGHRHCWQEYSQSVFEFNSETGKGKNIAFLLIYIANLTFTYQPLKRSYVFRLVMGAIIMESSQYLT